MKRTFATTLSTAAASALLAGCLGSAPSSTGGAAGATGKGAGSTGGSTQPAIDAGGASGPSDDATLAARKTDFGLALRAAALKLVGDLPTLQEQMTIQRAPDPRAAYATQIDAYLADPRFAARMIEFHRNTFKLGGDAVAKMHPSFETAPTFAAMVVVKGRPYDDVLTASSMTCPTFDAQTGAFTDGDCQNGVPVTAGVLTDPGVQSQFVSNMAFRRTRWAQETFDCRRFPAEYSPAPVTMGNGQYTSPWPFDSITGGQGAAVDFHDTSSVVCANCHTTMNHIAPLFSHFDAMGMWQKDIQVTTPTMGLPKTQLTDWLPAGEPTAWRMGVEVSDLAQLGKAMAADADVQRCIVARAYDFAMSKGDVVNDLATVPDSVLKPYVDAYTTSNHDFKQLLRTAFTSDDFVKF